MSQRFEPVYRSRPGADGLRPGLGRERVYLEAFVRVRAHLAELPLDPQVRIGGDTGSPIALRKEGEPFLELARNTVARAEEAAQETGPDIEIGE